MSSSNMTYLVRTPDGSTYGPAEQDILLQWAENGRITRDCQVCNTLTKNWMPATKLEFLKELVDRASPEVKKDKRSRNKETPAYEDRVVYSLGKAGVFKYEPAGIFFRSAAFLMDLLVIGVPAYLALLGLWQVRDAVSDEIIFFVFTLGLIFYTMLYYAIGLGLKAQTVGQWFFGVMIIRPSGDPVLLTRATIWTLAHLCLGWTTFFLSYVLPSKKALPEMISGTVLCMINNRER